MICVILVIIRMRVLAEKRGDEDLLEFAAIQTPLNGGTVYWVGAEKMPEPAPFAAMFRYSFTTTPILATKHLGAK